MYILGLIILRLISVHIHIWSHHTETDLGAHVRTHLSAYVFIWSDHFLTYLDGHIGSVYADLS